MNIRYSLSIVISLLLWACNTNTVPRPKGMLRLQYPEAGYETLKKEDRYQFEKNKKAITIGEEEYTLNLKYPDMKATLFITYKEVNNNLEELLTDTQKLTYEHVVKADKITETPFVNQSQATYGMLYEISGNAASQLQFYVTDSTRHFLTGSLYFRTRPNYDSVLPAVAYLKNDIKKIMESLQWNNQR